MYEVSSDKNKLSNRISPIVEQLFQENILFRERLNKDEMIQLVSNLLLENFSIEQLKAIDDDDLKERIDGVLVIEAVSGTLNDLTPEQIEMFDSAVAGR
ncbi:hypothetical protein F7734_25515 [Scytonema sp. UIC 10036]|uniref:hypothetical protein n=1 Tax=Scytonema sp. UIC 10036 TaxID=2304196 RepID=UPI0012DAD919|nr:hypothetical protein [Scytonema sp. UIC 10036]MUG95537.1 hypothetical protein [Scytonema sp. UIC 10036]